MVAGLITHHLFEFHFMNFVDRSGFCKQNLNRKRICFNLVSNDLFELNQAHWFIKYLVSKFFFLFRIDD